MRNVWEQQWNVGVESVEEEEEECVGVLSVVVVVVGSKV